MRDPREDLRSTEEAISRDAEQVQTLEEEKAALDPSDPQVERISERVERVATGLKEKAVAERELSDEIQAPD
jgi:hypothetical protein